MKVRGAENSVLVMSRFVLHSIIANVFLPTPDLNSKDKLGFRIFIALWETCDIRFHKWN